MGSRRYLYFLPAPGERLDFCAAARTLVDGGLGFQSPAFVNTIDSNGVLVEAMEQKLEPPTAEMLCALMYGSRGVGVLCGDNVVLFGCTFGSPHDEPLFSINVSRRTWVTLDEYVREGYESLLAEVAEKSGARIVIVLDDPADDFLGRLCRVDDTWLVDMQLPDGSEYDAAWAWVAPQPGVAPIMRNLESTGRDIGGFAEFREQP